MVKPSKEKSYNIIYSIICHQEIDVIKNLTKNIIKFNKNNRFFICLHLNNINYKFRKTLTSNHVIINDIFYDKKSGTHLLCKPHLDNFLFLKNKKYKFYNFITLSSRCRFIKQMPVFEKQIYNPLYLNEEQDLTKLNRWWWPHFLKNKKIVKLFKSKKIALVKGQTSGRIFSRELIEDIYNFITKNNIFNKIDYECYIDEVLFPTLCHYYIGTKKNICCYKFGKTSSYIPSLDELKNKLNNLDDSICIIKKMPDDINHPIIKYIDSI